MNEMTLPPAPPPASEGDYGGSAARKKPSASGLEVSNATLIAADMTLPEYLKNLPDTPALNAAIAAVLADDTDNVPKRGYNSFHKYEYATADDVREHVAKTIGKHGLAYEQHEIGFIPLTAQAMGIVYLFRLTHESGEVGPFERHSVPASLLVKDSLDDKAFSKARVLALKDWSKTRLSIATGDPLEDPDADQQAPTAPPARSAPSSSQAFRNAGLPPKVEAGKATEAPSDPWLKGVISSLDLMNPGLPVLRALQKVLPTCESATQVAIISAHPRVTETRTSAPDEKRRELEALFVTASKRLAEGFEQTDPTVKTQSTPEPVHAGN